MAFSVRQQDWFLVGSAFVLLIAGLLTLFSAAPQFFIPQISWVVAALIIGATVSFIDLRPLVSYRWFIIAVYFFGLALLIATAFFGPVIRNARSWLVVGPAQFQTSEFMKLALIVLYSYYFAKEHIGIARAGNLLRSFLYLAIPAWLVFRQPDLGSALILFFIWAGFLFVSGIPWRHIVVGIIIAAILSSVAWTFFLKDYQRERIVGFLNPAHDPLGVNYSVIQAKIAIGSAGLWGKGFRQGTQVQLGFLPEPQSDFAFAAFVEEWGLLGALVVLGFFSLLIFRIVTIGARSESNFFRLFALGTAILFITQFVLNIGSALGLLPVTGVPFPFLSYGGSSLLINMILLGVVVGMTNRQSILRE